MNREDIAVALTTSFRSSLLAPFSTPELRAAFEQLKDFARASMLLPARLSRALFVLSAKRKRRSIARRAN